jgi:hypothetical protein
LAKLSLASLANYEKINTWQGKITSESMMIYRGGPAAHVLEIDANIPAIERQTSISKDAKDVVRRGAGEIEFKIDFTNNRSFRYVKQSRPSEYDIFATGQSFTSLSGTSEKTKIITSEFEIESQPVRWKKDGTVLQRMAKKQLISKSQALRDTLDPRICFYTGSPAWELLSLLSGECRKHNQGDVNNAYTIDLEEAPPASAYIIRLMRPGHTQWFEEFVFDGAKGMNPTHIEVKNDSGLTISRIDTDFHKMNGVFLPSKRHVRQYDGTDGNLRRDVEWNFSDVKVNTPLPKNTFSLDNLGLHDGDKYVDETTKKKYIYKGNGKIVEINEADLAETGSNASKVKNDKIYGDIKILMQTLEAKDADTAMVFLGHEEWQVRLRALQVLEILLAQNKEKLKEAASLVKDDSNPEVRQKAQAILNAINTSATKTK